MYLVCVIVKDAPGGGWTDSVGDCRADGAMSYKSTSVVETDARLDLSFPPGWKFSG